MSWKQKAKLENRCTNCGVSKTKSGNLCSECAEKHTRRNSEYVKNVRRLKSGTCHYCGNKSSTRMCDCCREKQKRYRKNRREEFKRNGVCVQCGKDVIHKSSLCLRHYMIQASDSAFGTTKYHKEMYGLFIKQNGRCYYTGEGLVIGETASVDHKIPRSKFDGGENIYHIENIVWCTKVVNVMKNGMTDFEFIRMCKSVVNNFSPDEPVESRRKRRAKKQEINLGLISI